MSVEPDFSLHPDAERARAAADALFEKTADALLRLLPVSADIRHVGATAVPGCITKGDLDIVVRVAATDFAAADAVLAARYSRNQGSARTDTFAAFEDDAVEPHLGIQLAVIDSADDFFHQFAYALRENSDLLARYNALKKSFDGRPMAEYRAAKDEFIAATLAGTRPRECS